MDVVVSMSANKTEHFYVTLSHTEQSSVEVKNAWSSNSAPPYAIMAWYLIN
jgi:hypothetical protein